jgi:hypothetical protein
MDSPRRGFFYIIGTERSPAVLDGASWPCGPSKSILV